jgi:hypothetical protein
MNTFTSNTLNDGWFVSFKCKHFRNTRHTNFWNTIVKLILNHPAYFFFNGVNTN